MKRIISILIVILIIIGLLPLAFGEEIVSEENSQVENFSDEESSDVDIEDDTLELKSGKKGKASPMVEEAKRSYKEGFNIPVAIPKNIENMRALYTAYTQKDTYLRSATDDDAEKLAILPKGSDVEIYEVEPNWVLLGTEKGYGWIKRYYLQEGSIKATDPKTVMPYGVQKPKYIATLKKESFIYNSPSNDGVKFKIPVDKGAKIAIMDFEEGFAKVIVWRNYGYIDAKNLENVISVSPTDEPKYKDMPIAAYCSFFDHNVGSEITDSRVVNILVSCKYMSKVFEPGESFDFNKQVGPYSKSKGYEPAPVLVDGGSKLGYGGGTCQSASTLYNTLMQVPGMTIIYRRPHGPGSAKYLPQHQDAAVGNNFLNFKFRNDYDFPVRVEAESVDGCLFIALYKDSL